MLKVLKGKMFRMIKDITDQFLITTRWRHLLAEFEKSLKVIKKLCMLKGFKAKMLVMMKDLTE